MNGNGIVQSDIFVELGKLLGKNQKFEELCFGLSRNQITGEDLDFLYEPL